MQNLSFGLPVLGLALLVSGCAHDPLAGSPARYSGMDLYAVYCSGCHGLSGDGVGSAAPFIAAVPPALTGIAARNGGTFPTEKVFRIIDGQFESPPPGTRHMPIWGYDLFTGEGDDETAHQQVLDMEHRIVKYIESIQEGPAVGR
jgi:mono/diheme cytochrome c family protein